MEPPSGSYWRCFFCFKSSSIFHIRFQFRRWWQAHPAQASIRGTTFATTHPATMSRCLLTILCCPPCLLQWEIWESSFQMQLAGQLINLSLGITWGQKSFLLLFQFCVLYPPTVWCLGFENRLTCLFEKLIVTCGRTDRML